MTTGNDRFRVEKAGAVANVTLCTPDEGNTLGPPDMGVTDRSVYRASFVERSEPPVPAPEPVRPRGCS